MSEGADSQSLLELILNTARSAKAGTLSTMPLLMSRVETELLPRGFASSVDPVPCYLVWYDGKEIRYTIHCICGLSKRIYPDDSGRCYYEHLVPACGWRVDLELEGHETKKSREERSR